MISSGSDQDAQGSSEEEDDDDLLPLVSSTTNAGASTMGLPAHPLQSVKRLQGLTGYKPPETTVQSKPAGPSASALARPTDDGAREVHKSGAQSGTADDEAGDDDDATSRHSALPRRQGVALKASNGHDYACDAVKKKGTRIQSMDHKTSAGPSRVRYVVRLKLSKSHRRAKQPQGHAGPTTKAGTRPAGPDAKSTGDERAPPFLRHISELEVAARRFRDLGRKVKHQADALAKETLSQEHAKNDAHAWLQRRIEITSIHQDALLLYAFSFWCEEEALGNRTQVVDNWRSLFGLLRFVIQAWGDISNKCAGSTELSKAWEVALLYKSFNALLESTVSFHLAELVSNRLLKSKLSQAAEMTKTMAPFGHLNPSLQANAPTPPNAMTGMSQGAASATPPTKPETLGESIPPDPAEVIKVLSELMDQTKRLSDDIAVARQSWEAMTMVVLDPFSKHGKSISPSITNGGWLRRISPDLWDACEESTYLAGTRRGWKSNDYRDEIPFALCRSWSKHHAVHLAADQSFLGEKDLLGLGSLAGPSRATPVVWPLTSQSPILHVIGFGKVIMETLA